MKSYLEKTIDIKMRLGATDRCSALEDIKNSIDEYGLYTFCKMFFCLNEDNSAEDFAIEFFTAYNNEVCKGTY